jgi:hypothetical protein
MTVIQIQRPHKRLALSCTKCGAAAEATCDCGSPYVPARERAAKAVAENPQKSNRAIADEVGVSYETVRRARETTDTPVSVDERIGLDGKVRRLPVRDYEPDVEDEVEPENYRGAFLMRADQARSFAVYSGPITREIVAMARQVAAAWIKLADEMEDRS